MAYSVQKARLGVAATAHAPLSILPLRERVAAALRFEIFDGVLRGGAELAQDEIAGRLGVSRMPVREAFQILEREGLLLRKTYRRAIVKTITEADVRDHYETRAFIEGELAARACMHPEMHDQIQSALARAERAAGGAEPGYVRAGEDFHRAIWRASGSETLSGVASQLWTGLGPHLLEFVPSAIEGSIREHRELLRLIRKANEDRARSAMSDHILAGLGKFLKHFQLRLRERKR